MGFMRILMGIFILIVLASGIFLFLLTLGHSMESCTASLQESGYTLEKSVEGCQFSEDLVNYRFVIYGVLLILLIIFGMIFFRN